MIGNQDERTIFNNDLHPIIGSWLFPPCVFNGKNVLEIGTIIINLLYT